MATSTPTPAPAQTLTINTTTTNPSTPGTIPPQTFDILPALHELLSRIDHTSTDLLTSPTDDADASTYPNRKPLEPKDLPKEVLEIKARVRKALRELEKLPDMDRSVEEQEEEIVELESRIEKQREMVRRLGRVAGSLEETDVEDVGYVQARGTALYLWSSSLVLGHHSALSTSKAYPLRPTKDPLQSMDDLIEAFAEQGLTTSNMCGDTSISSSEELARAFSISTNEDNWHYYAGNRPGQEHVATHFAAPVTQDISPAIVTLGGKKASLTTTDQDAAASSQYTTGPQQQTDFSPSSTHSKQVTSESSGALMATSRHPNASNNYSNRQPYDSQILSHQRHISLTSNLWDDEDDEDDKDKDKDETPNPSSSYPSIPENPPWFNPYTDSDFHSRYDSDDEKPLHPHNKTQVHSLLEILRRDSPSVTRDERQSLLVDKHKAGKALGTSGLAWQKKQKGVKAWGWSLKEAVGLGGELRIWDS